MSATPNDLKASVHRHDRPDPTSARRRGRRAGVGILAALGLGGVVFGAAAVATSAPASACTPDACIVVPQPTAIYQTQTILRASTTAVTASVTWFNPDGEAGFGWSPVSGVGAVSFADSSGATLGTVAVQGDGTATLPLGQLTDGQHAITAEFTGADGVGPRPTYQGSSSSPVTVTVKNAGLGPANATWSFAKTGTVANQLLEVHGNVATDGAAVDTWSLTMAGTVIQGNELWRYQPAQVPGYGQLVNVSSGKCLEVNGSTGAVDQWSCVPGAANELWRAQPGTSGNVSLQVKSSGAFLGQDPTSSLGNGAHLTMQAAQSALTDWTATQQP